MTDPDMHDLDLAHQLADLATEAGDGNGLLAGAHRQANRLRRRHVVARSGVAAVAVIGTLAAVAALRTSPGRTGAASSATTTPSLPTCTSLLARLPVKPGVSASSANAVADATPRVMKVDASIVAIPDENHLVLDTSPDPSVAAPLTVAIDDATTFGPGTSTRPSFTVGQHVLVVATSSSAGAFHADVIVEPSTEPGAAAVVGVKGEATVAALPDDQHVVVAPGPSSGAEAPVTLTIDESTTFLAAGTSTTRPALTVGQHVLFAATAAGTSGFHADRIDTSPTPDDATGPILVKAGGSESGVVTARGAGSTSADVSGIKEAGVLADGWFKAVATVVATSPSSLTVTLVDATTHTGETITAAVDGEPFKVNDTACDPGALAPGTQIGILLRTTAPDAYLVESATPLNP